MKKPISTILLAASLFSICAAPVSAYEYDKDAIKKEFKCKLDETPAHVLEDMTSAMTISDNVYENDLLRLEVKPNITMEYLQTGSETRKSTSANSIVMVAAGGLMGFALYVPVLPNLEATITNKTEAPLEIDLDRSQISIGGYSGRGVQSGMKYNDASSALQPPLIIFPNSTKEVTLWRTDFTFRKGGIIEDSRWIPPFDLATNKNLLGEMILKINDKYITLVPSAIIDESKLHWPKIRK